MTNYVNFGDVSPEHGQLWIDLDQDSSFPDCTDCVEILCGSDIGLADNQYMISSGSIYFSPDNWDSALSVIGLDSFIGPPTFADVAYAFNAYQGFDRPYGQWDSIVQVGKDLDDWTASGSQYESETTLHGNASIQLYINRNYL